MPCEKKLWPEPSRDDTFSTERSLWQQGYTLVAGADEVGRGPLAGPVVAACVILPADCDFKQFHDSKVLSAPVREELAAELERIGAQIGVGVVSPAEIDRVNILQASLLAMKMALESLPCQPDYLLVDGNFPVPVTLPQQTLIKGESRSASIAAASIVAKVRRDALMEQYHQRFPEYNFHKHKGYATAEHLKNIKRFGPCEIHRRSFKPVRDCFVKGHVQQQTLLGEKG